MSGGVNENEFSCLSLTVTAFPTTMPMAGWQRLAASLFPEAHQATVGVETIRLVFRKANRYVPGNGLLNGAVHFDWR